MPLNPGDFIQSSISNDDYEVKKFIAAGGFGSAFWWLELATTWN